MTRTTKEQRADLEAKAKASQWRDASGVGSAVALEAYRGAANPTTVLALLADLKEAEAELERMRDDAVKKQRAIDKLAEYADLYDQARGALDEARAERDKFKAELLKEEGLFVAARAALSRALGERDRLKADFNTERERASRMAAEIHCLRGDLSAACSERDKLKADNNKLREHTRGEIRAWFDENKDAVVRDVGDDNGRLEKENDELKAQLAEAVAARETAVRLAMRSDANLAKAVEAYDQATGLLKAQLAEARAELAARKEAMDAREKIDAALADELATAGGVRAALELAYHHLDRFGLIEGPACQMESQQRFFEAYNAATDRERAIAKKGGA